MVEVCGGDREGGDDGSFVIVSFFAGTAKRMCVVLAFLCNSSHFLNTNAVSKNHHHHSYEQ